MTDHPVLIPTGEGPVGGVVSEPSGKWRGALILLPGYGRPARSGVNSFWTRTARALAEQQGLVVLRFDYCREGETLPIGEVGQGQAWKLALDLRLLDHATRWFRRRTGEAQLLLAGTCSGARLAVELAAAGSHPVADLLLVVPYLRSLTEPAGLELGETAESEAIDPQLVERLRSILPRTPAWILAGERDRQDVPGLQRLLGPEAGQLDVEVVAGVELHLLDRQSLQEETASRLLARTSAVLAR